ncbi:MAG TPA: UDP-N-acetylmuramate dehydrogenase [Candidatus Limnocylindrales bacterium]|nr:UDP-N-acetylmuramate dehydrogenase [Candidatus Limnocylindrales bacterium]
MTVPASGSRAPRDPRALAEMTTLRVGGPARAVVHAATDEDLVAAVTAADAAGEPVLLVGGGSNLLVADAGFPGTVVRIATRGVQVEPSAPGRVRVRVAAGEPWETFVATAVESGWSGVEALSGIPGCTGATPIQNVGAYGAEVAQVIESLEVLDRRSGAATRMEPAAVGFGYRSSLLKREPGRWVVLSVLMDLAVDPLGAPVRYAELAGVLGVRVGDRAPAAAVRQAVLELRRGKGMVLDDSDHDTWSAGSFFTNPIVSATVADTLPADAPRFPQPDGSVKTSAAWLISHAGFAKGFAVRPGAPAALSTKHSLALTNRGGATAQDLLELARVVRTGVADRFGIVLENEPVLVGCAL